VKRDHIAMVSFEKGFSSRSAGAVRECKCGRVFYNPGGNWDFEDGEIERLAKDPNATALEWAVESIILENIEYALDCDCWRERAIKVINWLLAHDDSIAEFLSLERERKQAEASRAPVVRTA